ncbi:hypothetical protein FGG08_000624 [Glutinoglossum americanum]|uniref:Uncharacterized protein n=1 Tax=Glutinoglossum americanum TaxID=1670608 RepID=A0A9P8L5X5_9PEZI|nr:hypothetical protein FGG08_000624 [Glutinoglossum americanum]
MLSSAQAFRVLWLYRYVRLIVNCVSHWTFKPIPLPEKPTLTSKDVTIIIPTIDGEGPDFQQTLCTCLSAAPSEIILVTIDANLERLKSTAALIHSSCIRVVSVAHANKRRQMCRVLPEVLTKITLFADDDVIWPPRILDWILAAFEKPDIGGVGTSQRLRRADCPNIWGFLGALYLERRNFEISATTHIDGRVSCLSGRTVTYCTHILQDLEFTYGFTHESWLGRYQLNTDDDNFITRWMVSHGWKTYIQYCREAELQTTLEDNPRFLKQCLRWSRSNWRSNLTSMLRERYIWKGFKAIANMDPGEKDSSRATLSPPAIIGDGLLVFLLIKTTQNWGALSVLLLWMLISKFVKLLGHFVRYPEDVVLLPVSILFGYFHGFIKVYAFFTLNITAWGTREGADVDDGYRMIPIDKRKQASFSDWRQKLSW